MINKTTYKPGKIPHFLKEREKKVLDLLAYLESYFGFNDFVVTHTIRRGKKGEYLNEKKGYDTKEFHSQHCGGNAVDFRSKSLANYLSQGNEVRNGATVYGENFTKFKKDLIRLNKAGVVRQFIIEPTDNQIDRSLKGKFAGTTLFHLGVFNDEDARQPASVLFFNASNHGSNRIATYLQGKELLDITAELYDESEEGGVIYA